MVQPYKLFRQTFPAKTPADIGILRSFSDRYLALYLLYTLCILFALCISFTIFILTLGSWSMSRVSGQSRPVRSHDRWRLSCCVTPQTPCGAGWKMRTPQRRTGLTPRAIPCVLIAGIEGIIVADDEGPCMGIKLNICERAKSSSFDRIITLIYIVVIHIMAII